MAQTRSVHVVGTMKPNKINLVAAVAGLWIAAPPSGHTQPSWEAEYNRWNARGNVLAQRGAFSEAIVAWRRAIPLDRGPIRQCRGEGQRVSIQAAQDTLEAARTPGRLSVLPGEPMGSGREPLAVRWFRSRESALWLGNPCNLP